MDDTTGPMKRRIEVVKEIGMAIGFVALFGVGALLWVFWQLARALRGDEE
jgi:hypothetical protein